MRIRFFLAALVAAPLAGCLPPMDDKPAADDTLLAAEFVGRWVEVLLGGNGGGFELFADGTATSIGQPELNYVSWRAKPNKLFLTTAETVGNAIKTAEVEYLARIEDETRMYLNLGGDLEWPQVFRMID